MLALRAFCLAKLNRLDAARTSAREALRVAPESAHSHFALAIIEMQLNDFDAARREFVEALRREPRNAVHFGCLSLCYQATHQWREALGWANAGLKLLPNDSRLLSYRALALARLGRTDESDATIRQALQANAAGDLAHFTAAEVQLRAGRKRLANPSPSRNAPAQSHVRPSSCHPR